MKKYQIWLIILFLIFGGVFSFFLFKNYNATASETDRITGWGWSDNAGWISMNCTNIEGECLVDQDSNGYGLNIEDYSIENAWHFDEYGFESVHDPIGDNWGAVPDGIEFIDEGVISEVTQEAELDSSLIFDGTSAIQVQDYNFKCDEGCTVGAWLKSTADNSIQNLYFSSLLNPLATSIDNVFSEIIFTEDVWTYVAIIFDSEANTLSFYKKEYEGVGGYLEESSEFIDISKNGSNSMYIGSITGDDYFTGGLDELRIYEKALSEEDLDNISNFPETVGLISGWAWSSNAGYVCYGSTCYDQGLEVSPDGPGDPVLAYYNSHGVVKGWANFVNLVEDDSSENYGWMKLNKQFPNSLVGEVQGDVNFPPEGYMMKPDYDEPDDGVIVYTGHNCVNCQGDYCDVCFGADFEFDSRYYNPPLYNTCIECDGDQCEWCRDFDEYGTALMFESEILTGWSWSGASFDGSEPDMGWGWVNYVGIPEYNPYLQTKEGDVYAKSFDLLSAPTGRYNATFLLQSGEVDGISGFVTEEISDEWTIDNYDMSLPTRSTNYYSKIGSIDITGLFAGQYGKVELPCSTTQVGCKIASLSDLGDPLAGKVYYYDSDLTIEVAGGLEISNGAINAGTDGSGTIVVNGANLYIKSNISYQPIMPLNEDRQLGSLGIIVLKAGEDDPNPGVGGNLYIDGDVNEIAGSYFVEGVVETGLSSNQLTVNGLMIGGEFALERTFVDAAGNPSELIIYDQRIIQNPPPGFTDIVKALPDWEQ